jgi:hypothetical protein
MLSATVMVLAALSVLVPATEWVAVAVLTTLIGVPWLVWRATRHPGTG